MGHCDNLNLDSLTLFTSHCICLRSSLIFLHSCPYIFFNINSIELVIAPILPLYFLPSWLYPRCFSLEMSGYFILFLQAWYTHYSVHVTNILALFSAVPVYIKCLFSFVPLQFVHFPNRMSILLFIFLSICLAFLLCSFWVVILSLAL